MNYQWQIDNLTCLIQSYRKRLMKLQENVSQVARRALANGSPEAMRAALEQLATQGEFSRITEQSNDA